MTQKRYIVKSQSFDGATKCGDRERIIFRSQQSIQQQRTYIPDHVRNKPGRQTRSFAFVHVL